MALIDFVRAYLDEHGIESRLVPDETGAKANLYATIGPTDRPGVMLSGHSDVVPVEGQAWTSDPFAVTARSDTIDRAGWRRHVEQARARQIDGRDIGSAADGRRIEDVDLGVVAGAGV